MAGPAHRQISASSTSLISSQEDAIHMCVDNN